MITAAFCRGKIIHFPCQVICFLTVGAQEFYLENENSDWAWNNFVIDDDDEDIEPLKAFLLFSSFSILCAREEKSWMPLFSPEHKESFVLCGVMTSTERALCTPYTPGLGPNLAMGPTLMHGSNGGGDGDARISLAPTISKITPIYNSLISSPKAWCFLRYFRFSVRQRWGQMRVRKCDCQFRGWNVVNTKVGQMPDGPNFQPSGLEPPLNFYAW